MKKRFILTLSFIFATTGAFAVEKIGPDAARAQHREEMKKIKAEMRQKKEANPQTAKTSSKMDEFWSREKQRSGFGGAGDRMGSWMKNLNPMPFFKNQDEQYKARKTGGQVK